MKEGTWKPCVSTTALHSLQLRSTCPDTWDHRYEEENGSQTHTVWPGSGGVGSELRARAQGGSHTVPRGLSWLQPREPPRRPGVTLQGDRDKGGNTSSPKRLTSSWRNKVAILKGLITQMIRQYRNQRKTRRKPHMTRPGVIFKKGRSAARDIHRGRGSWKQTWACTCHS